MLWLVILVRDGGGDTHSGKIIPSGHLVILMCAKCILNAHTVFKKYVYNVWKALFKDILMGNSHP